MADANADANADAQAATILAVVLLSVVGILVIPLPPVVLDGLLGVNLAGAVIRTHSEIRRRSLSIWLFMTA
jgi:type III secretory pathway component EscV